MIRCRLTFPGREYSSTCTQDRKITRRNNRNDLVPIHFSSSHLSTREKQINIQIEIFCLLIHEREREKEIKQNEYRMIFIEHRMDLFLHSSFLTSTCVHSPQHHLIDSFVLHFVYLSVFSYSLKKRFALPFSLSYNQSIMNLNNTNESN